MAKQKKSKQYVELDLEEYEKEVKEALKPAPEYLAIQRALRELERLLYA